jgi:predicted branched-subunit amino acid permease
VVGSKERGKGAREVAGWAATLPVAAAIAVFGAMFGALASPVMGPTAAIASSLLIWSGAIQFAAVGLLRGGVPGRVVLATAAVLSLRNLLLGAMVRPHLGATAARRAALSWFLIDEIAGLAIASRAGAARVLAFSGALCYLAWNLGTVLGVIGGSWPQMDGLSAAVFPVLFLGLAGASGGPDRGAGPRGARGRLSGGRPPMTATLLLGLAALNYLSRSSALVFLPAPAGRIGRIIERVPGPLFAGMATILLFDSSGRLADWPTIGAAVGCAVTMPTRSLLAGLMGGLAGYTATSLILWGAS